ncbi:MAG: S8 family peptidase [Bacteroidales bacterium]|nr:S8 family peptidase [Bacteroidales bacterium]
MKRYFLLLIISMFVCLSADAQNYDVIEPELQAVLEEKGDEMISVNIILKSEINIKNLRSNVKNISDVKAHRQAVVSEFKRFSELSQKDVMTIIEAGKASGEIKDVKAHWLSNMITCTANKNYIYLLSTHHDVKTLGYNEMHYLLWDERSEDVEAQRAGITPNVKYVNADNVWDSGYTGEGVLVAVIDTGVNFHEDLANNLWDGGEEYPNHGYNTFENSHDVSDGFDHGTHCAGIIVGDGTSGMKTGVAPDATLMCVKVMNDGGSGNANTVCSGIEFAIEHGADVLNMSLGFPLATASSSTKEALRQTCVNALEANVAIIAAVGNDRMLNLTYPVPTNARIPAGCPPPWLHPDQQANAGGLSAVIAVGAIDYQNNIADFSSKGPVTWQASSYADYPYIPGREIGLIRPDLCAPGVSIMSLDSKNSTGYKNMDGTSQAAPCVTGVVCLMLQKKPYLTPAQICEALETTAKKLSETKSNDFGSGCVDAFLAMQEIEDYQDVTGIEDNIYRKTAEIYPNPVDDILSIATETQIDEIAIYDIYGRQALSQQVDKSTSQQVVNVGNLKAGVYFIKIKTDKENIVKRFVKN